MTHSIPDSLSLPAPNEIEAAVRGQRELAAYLSTKVETQKNLDSGRRKQHPPDRIANVFTEAADVNSR
ncbi:hypothetical protein OS31_48050 [Dickeya oryzae]